MIDQFAPYEPEYIKRWREYLASASKPAKPVVKPVKKRKGKKAKK